MFFDAVGQKMKKQPHCKEGFSMAKVKNVDFVVYFLQGVPQARLPCLQLFTTLIGTFLIFLKNGF